MMGYLEIVVMVALLAAWVVILLMKWGVAEWLQVHGDSFTSRMASCSFCLSWWVCVLLSFAFAFWCGELKYMAVPFFATPITRMMV
jgi:hypothetical protein